MRFWDIRRQVRWWCDLEIRLGVVQGHWKQYHSKAWYDFLIAFYSNYGSILYHFWDKTRYWLKMRVFHNPCIRRSVSGGPRRNIAITFGLKKLESTRRWKKFGFAVSKFHTLPACDGRTDRRTDRHFATAQSALRIASCGKNFLDLRVDKAKTCISTTQYTLEQQSCRLPRLVRYGINSYQERVERAVVHIKALTLTL